MMGFTVSGGFRERARRVKREVKASRNWYRDFRHRPDRRRVRSLMIILGVILLIIGFVAKIAILWTIGIVVLLIGVVLAILGMAGHAVGGRRHYF
jgi:uncharacterized membrane protein HdeD (DUF308 family)